MLDDHRIPTSTHRRSPAPTNHNWDRTRRSPQRTHQRSNGPRDRRNLWRQRVMRVPCPPPPRSPDRSPNRTTTRYSTIRFSRPDSRGALITTSPLPGPKQPIPSETLPTASRAQTPSWTDQPSNSPSPWSIRLQRSSMDRNAWARQTTQPKPPTTTSPSEAPNTRIPQCPVTHISPGMCGPQRPSARAKCAPPGLR